MNINDVKFILQKNSPEIIIGFGIGCGIIAAISACQATLHVEEQLDKLEDTKERINEIPDEEGINKGKELTQAHLRCAKNIAKLYAPAIGFGAISIASIMKGNDILRARNVALVGACQAWKESTDIYREKVAAKLGKEVESELWNGLDRKDIEYTEISEDGKEKKRSKKNAKVAGDESCSPYSIDFDSNNINWKPSAERNLHFLRMMQAEANDMLQIRGHLFLNEVYDLIGYPRTKKGQFDGWVRGNGDVDFGIYEFFKEGCEHNNDFVNGYYPSCRLNFNVNGPILDLI